MIFGAKKSNLKKYQLIVLNPFLDSLGHSGLKNIGLPPGAGSGCFQSSQDVVIFHHILGRLFADLDLDFEPN